MSDFKKKPAAPANKPPAKQNAPKSNPSSGSSMRPSAPKSPASGGAKSGLSSGGSKPPTGSSRIQKAAVSSTVPSGLSAEIATKLSELDSRLSTLQGELGFSEHYQAVADLDSGLSQLADLVTECRRRGYCYQNFLERKIETISTKWQAARPHLLREIEQAERELQPLLNTTVQTRNGMSGGAAALAVNTFDRNLDALESRIKSAETAFTAAYGGVRDTYHQTEYQVDLVKTMLDELDSASFPLLAGETPVRSVKARWWRDGQNKGPEGILYITDQRVLFEQKEEVATKKVLFIATEKETIRQLVFDAPLGSLQNIKSSSRGLMGHEDHLDFEFGSGAPYPQAHFHINGQESDEWVSLVKRVQNGDIQAERVQTEGQVQAGQGGDAAASSAPQKCTACGASISTPIVHGQRQIICEYCGNTMRW